MTGLYARSPIFSIAQKLLLISISFLVFVTVLITSTGTFVLHLLTFQTPIKDAKKKRFRFEPVKTTDIPVFTHLLAG